MSAILDKMKTVSKLYHAQGCTEDQIEKAEKELGLRFPQAFIDYVKMYGVISFYGTEWAGLNIDGSLNVVEVTKEERNYNPNFPKDCFVIERQGIDSIVTVVNELGEVFDVQYDEKVLICSSLEEYLDICISRKNN